MIVDNRPDPLIGNLFPLCSYEDYKQRLKEAKERKIAIATTIDISTC